MTETQIAQALALGRCKFSPGSAAKRFVAWVVGRANQDEEQPTELSAKAVAMLDRLAHSYRKQIGRCMSTECELRKSCTSTMTNDEWKKLVEEHGQALISQIKAITPDARIGLHGVTGTLCETSVTFRDHGALLEAQWPGCSVMWDAHPELRTWWRYALAVTRNYVGTRPYGGQYVSEHSLGHRKHRKSVDRVIEAAREHGPIMLVAYELHPPRWQPAQIVVENIGINDTTDPPQRYIQHGFVPIRAIYTARETRWTLVR